MKYFVLSIGALALLGLSSPATAQSLFERCQKDKQHLDEMKQSAGDLGTQIGDLDRQLADLNRRLRETQAARAAKLRQKASLEREIRRTEHMVGRRCRGLQRCERLEKQVADLKQRMAPLSDRLHAIREEIRQRNAETAALNRDVQRIENQYNQLGCANLQIGQTAQSTFDRCSQLARDWSDVQNRIGQLQTSVQRLRQAYQRVMGKMRASGVQLARLLKEFRKSCSHSHQLATLEEMEKRQHEYQSLGAELNQMDTQVRKFKMLKLKPVKTRPHLKPKPDEGKRRHQRKKTLKPVK